MNSAARKIQAAYRSWRLILYNGIAKETELGKYIKEMFMQVTGPDLNKPKKLPKAIKEVSILYDPSLKNISFTTEYGVKGTSKAYNAIRWNISYRGKLHLVTLYKSGEIHYTGGYSEKATTESKELLQTPSDVLRIALGKWPEKNFEIKLNNITIQKRFSRGFILENINNAIYEPEINPFASVKRKGAFYKIYANGLVQISSITSNNLKEIVSDANEFIKTLKRRINLGLVKQKQNKKPTSKAQTRKNLNIAPNVKSRATTCPKDKCPVPNTFEGKCPDGYYLAPNPQGFPCCYKIPIKTAYKKNKIIAAFGKLGIQIPEHTKKVFNIRNVNNSNKPTLVSGHVGTYRFIVSKNRSGADVFKIDSRQCKRYTIQKLVDIAMKLGLIQYAKSRDKDTLCTAILRHAISKGLINPKNNIPRIGGRLCSHYTKDELRSVVRKKYGITLTSDTLAGMCQELKQRIRSPSPPPSSSSSVNRSVRSRSRSSSVNSNFAKSLEKAVRSRSSSVNRSPTPSPNNNIFADFNVRKYLRKHTNRKNFTNEEVNAFKKIVISKASKDPEKVMNYMRNSAYVMFGEKFGPKKVGGIVIKETM